MGADDVFKVVLGAVVVVATIGEEYGGASHTEEIVGHEQGPVLTLVPVVPHYLSAHHHSAVVGVGFKHVPCQVHHYDPSAAAHPAKVVAQYVAPHLVVVYNLGRKQGCGLNVVRRKSEIFKLLCKNATMRNPKLQQSLP
ncbi:hypothetical protein CJ030_MR8G009055 [Morella rubra]|uniref:Uncharacterized protein n=1 Tax=Morella rubra TaxID=262757 RepID=A0A6A1UX60_9ROSI|nr:hypothetical protein CJ030_MR8G009055 [Morella rubra]